MKNTEQQARLALSTSVQPDGEFEILAITAGVGNGWSFPAAVLKESLPLWDQARCFIDHAWQGRSLRDLAGVCLAPRWDEERQGIRMRLKALGPSATLLSGLGKDVLETGTAGVGFSADVVFQAEEKQVRQIVRVLSVDLVLNPARGGEFLRALNAKFLKGENKMDETVEKNQDETQKNGALSREMLAGTQPMDAVEAQKLRAQMCQYLLDSALAASGLPQVLRERIRQQFGGKVFENSELEQALESARQVVSELTASRVVQGPGRIHGVFSSEDQISAAVHDLLGAGRPSGLEGLKTARLSGIRELYTMMTGDVDFMGGYNPRRAQFAASADLPGILKNAFNKMIISSWEELGRSGYRWWEPVVSVVHFNSLQPITGVLVGEIALLPSVSEGAAYGSLDVADSAETASWGKYGGYVGLTLEMFERDETHKLRQYPHKLTSSALRRISNLVGSVFTSNSGAGPVMSDTRNVFNAAYHGNTSGSADALSQNTWEAAGRAIYNQKMLTPSSGSATAPKLALDARYLIVPRELRLEGMNLLYPSFAHESYIFSENMQKGQMGDVITSPEFTDSNDWAAVADPLLAPGIILAERFGVMPEIFIADQAANGALFSNDEVRMKVRHWVSVFVADYRPLYKANVA